MADDNDRGNAEKRLALAEQMRDEARRASAVDLERRRAAETQRDAAEAERDAAVFELQSFMSETVEVPAETEGRAWKVITDLAAAGEARDQRLKIGAMLDAARLVCRYALTPRGNFTCNSTRCPCRPIRAAADKLEGSS
jgi:hypothetical protein